MKAHLTRRYWIAASHRLHNEAFSESKNRETYGKCNNPYGHGHNYAIEVTVSGDVERATGMVCNLVEIDELVRREIIERFDHEDLNTKTEFQNLVPTTENLVIVVFNILKPLLSFAHLEKVRIEETSNNSFEYAGELQVRADLRRH